MMNNYQTLKKALYLAYDLHKNQKDKNGNDYILHPLTLALLSQNDDEKITALLHDILEDCDYPIEKLTQDFKPSVIEALKLLNHNQNQDYLTYIQNLSTNPLAKAVKLLDLRNNMDLSRLSNITQKDIWRLENKYKPAYRILKKGELMNAYFAGGCFWCITPIYDQEEGVLSVTAGYSGGEEANPTYEQVKKQETNHRESINIEYDPSLISYDKLIDIFLENVDPFDGEGQFIDRGHSYTLAIYYNDEKEKEIASNKISKLEKDSQKQVFISLEKFKKFYDAEEYHQQFYLKQPEAFAKELIESGRKKAD